MSLQRDAGQRGQRPLRLLLLLHGGRLRPGGHVCRRARQRLPGSGQLSQACLNVANHILHHRHAIGRLLGDSCSCCCCRGTAALQAKGGGGGCRLAVG